MMKKILQVLSVTLMIFTASLSAMAIQEVNLEQPVMEIPAEIVGFTYAEGWWDVTPTSTSTVSASTAGFTGYSDANFTLNTQVTTDYSVYSSYSYSQCMWNQGMRLLDMSIDELIAQGGGWSSGWTTFGQYNFGPGWGGGSFELMADLSVDSCPMPMPQIAPEPIVINVGYFGTSHVRYDYDGVVYGLYKKRHMHADNSASCPTTCGPGADDVIPVVVTDGHYPGSRMRASIPYGPLGCLIVGGLAENATRFICFDTNWN